jgi:thiamine-phosphate diphosphorylase
MKRPLGAVHLIADLDALDAMPRPLDRIRALLDAGLPSLQVRAPGRPAGERARRAEEIAALARAAGAAFVVNADVDLARTLHADGVHVPASGPPPIQVRARLPEGCAVGTSCHGAHELPRAHGCDWIFLSPVFPTPSKPGTAGLGIERLAKLVAASDRACYALGGVDASRASACFDAGVAGVAAIRGLLDPDGEELIRVALERVAHGPRPT